MGPVRDDSDAETGSVLSADELDIERSDNVVALDEGRYVIGSEGEPSVASEPALESAPGERRESEQTTGQVTPEPGGATPDSGQTPEPKIDARDVRRWLEDDLEDVESNYGFHISAKSEGAISHQQMYSDDVGTVFDSLLMWYAQQVDKGTAVEDVLGILLMESNVRVRYSPRCFRGVLDAHDLSPDDSIADLFEAIRDDGGVVFPPETDR